MEYVQIFDTTLRDGEQSPGISLNTTEKLEIAHQLARLGVDVIEAGFPIASPGDFEAVQAIAREVDGPVITGLARVNPGTSNVHGRPYATRHDLGSTRSSPRPTSTSSTSCSRRARTSRAWRAPRSRRPRSTCDDVEFSPMDATRADVEFTAEVIQIALDEGATTINIPDTVGYAMPHEYAGFLTRLYELVPKLRDVTLSVHCHDDLGLAVANSFAGVQAGARQVECAINGIGERAGNASLEEIVMLLRTRGDAVGFDTRVDTTEIARTSRLVSRLTGYPVQPNKAIVGRNAFAHESGIHQDGVLKERTTYEIMDARTIGLEGNDLVLGKHSGRHALRQALEELGYPVDGQALRTAFERFKELADKKKQVTAMDLEALVTDELRDADLRLRARVVRRRRVLAPPAARHGVGDDAGRVELGGLVHRRRPGRRDLPRDQHRDRGRRAAARVPRRRGDGRPGRARRGRRSCSSSRGAPRPARASRPTSCRRRASPTRAR